MTYLAHHRQDTDAGPVPPPWAARSVPEDGGLTHERLSCARPAVLRWSVAGALRIPTEVSVSVRDTCDGGQWMRSTPTVQIEGGSYPLDAVRALRDALDDLLAHFDTDGAPARPA